MISLKIEIVNEKGMHVRPSSLLAKTARFYDSEVSVECNGVVANGKNAIELLTLEAFCGSIVTVTVQGTDENEAIKEIEDLVKDGFHDAY